jgi:hypothetical protein
MAAPTLIQYAETAWTGAGTKSTPAITWLTGDLIVVLALDESGTVSVAAPTASGLVFTAGTAVGTSSANCEGNSWSAVAASGGSQAVTSAGATANDWGMAVWVFRNSGGIGNRATSTTSAKTVSLVRSGANSFVVFASGDFAAAATAGYSFTPAVGNDRQHVNDGAHYSVYVADFGDQGTAGTTSYGTSGETSAGPFTNLALEILGTASAGANASMPPQPGGQTWRRRNRRVQQIPPALVAASADATATPTAVPGSTSVPVPVLSTGSLIAATAVPGSTSVPVPVAAAGAVATPTAVPGSTSVPTPVVAVGSLVAATAAPGSTSVSVPVVSAGSVIAPTAAPGSTSIPVPGVKAGTGITAIAVPGSTSIPVPAVSAGGSATATATAVGATSSIPTPVVHAGSVIAPTAIASAALIPVPAVSTGVRVTPTAVASASLVPVPGVITIAPVTYGTSYVIASQAATGTADRGQSPGSTEYGSAHDSSDTGQTQAPSGTATGRELG